MPAERFDFPNAQGQKLAALLDRPPGEPRAYALFAHCFTCGKDVHAAKRIADGLTALGIARAALRLHRARRRARASSPTPPSPPMSPTWSPPPTALRAQRAAPAILIGHSLGGAAVLAAAADVPEARAVVTIAAPSDPAHVTGLFQDHLGEIRAQGRGRGRAGGPAVPHQPRLRRRSRGAQAAASASPTCARRCWSSTRRPTRWSASRMRPHLHRRQASEELRLACRRRPSAEPPQRCGLRRQRHPRLGRTLSRHAGAARPSRRRKAVVVTRNAAGQFQQEVTVGPHRFLADEPVDVGGLDSGPGPYDLLLAGLGACTAMTLRLYAERKALPLERVTVELDATPRSTPPTAKAARPRKA